MLEHVLPSSVAQDHHSHSQQLRLTGSPLDTMWRGRRGATGRRPPLVELLIALLKKEWGYMQLRVERRKKERKAG
jgi:hypothetical protein